MKKIALIFAAMLAMAQMNAATTDAAVNNPDNAEAPAIAEADDNGNETIYDHPFKNDDEKTKHWSITTNGVYVGMGVSHSFDMINNSVEAGLLNAIAVNYNSLHGQNISLGVGIQHRSYSMKRPNMLFREFSGNKVKVTVYPTYDIGELKNRSSNLNMWSVQFPLMFSQRIVKKLDITVAGIMNWNTYARVDNHFELDKIENDNKYKGLNQNKINFDFMGGLTWNAIGVYCRYSPGKFFKEGFGPEIKKTWTIGLTLAL